MNTIQKPIAKIFAFFLIISLWCGASSAQVTLTINKSNNAATPILSGVPFTYTIGYSWSGGVPAGGTLIIQDILPPGLDANYPYTNYPANTTYNGVTNTVTYTQTGITTTAGSGVLQVYAAFKYGVTCNGTRICDTAQIKEQGSQNWISSNSSCAVAAAANHWTFENELYAGCAACPANEVIFRVKVINPSGPYGGLNMTNMKLTYTLPAGAVINNVMTWGPLSPIVQPTTNPSGFTRSALGSNSIVITGDPTTVLSVWNYWQTFYIHVSFPCNQVGTTVISNASLNYNTPCDTIKPLNFSDTAKVTLCQAVDKGNLYKDFIVTTYDPYNPYFFPNTITPMCCGTYRLFYSNTGTVSQTGVVVTDTIPGSMDVSQFYTDIPAGMGPVKVEVWKYPAGPWTVVNPAMTVPTTTIVLPAWAPIAKIRWTYAGSLAVATGLTNSIDVCVRTTNFRTGAAVVPSQLIIDTLAVQDAGGVSQMTTNTLTVSQTSPHLIAEKAFVGTCDNSGAHPGGPWFPGDIIRFRIAVANVGSATATPCTITDLLPAGFSYQGNETYYYGPILPPGNWLTAYTPACNTFTNFANSTAMLAPILGSGTLTMPTIGTANPNPLVWTFQNLPARCDGTPYYFIIEFDVKVIDTPVPTLPGTYPNNFTMTATNATSATSNTAYVVISSRPGLVAKKEVRSSPSGTFGPNATIIAGGTGEYRITVKNTGNVPLANVCLLDILPHVGDIGVLQPYAPRGSQFNIVLTTPLGAIPNFGSKYYNNVPNPTATGNPSRLNTTLCNGFCVSADAPAATTGGAWALLVPAGGTYSFNVSASPSSYTIPPGGMLQFIVPFTVPASARVGDTACNSFAYQCSPAGSTTCLAAEPIDVCIKVVKDTSGTGPCPCPCDSAIMAPTNIYNNIQTQWKTITIFNKHCSPIDSINLRYYDCSTGLLIPQINLAALNGGNLHVYRNPSTNVTQPYSMFNASNRYQHMPLPVNTLLPAYGSPLTQDRVSFDLGLNYFLIPPSWCIRIIIYHANGDSCIDTLPRWTPVPPGDGGGGIGHDTIKTGTVYGVAISIDPKKFDQHTLGHVSVTVADSTDVIVGGSGALWESQSDNSQLPRPLEFVQSKRTALFKIMPDSQKSLMQFYVFLMHNADGKKPKVTIGVFDDESNMIATDTIATSNITSGVRPTPGIMPQGELHITSVQPNPARNSIEVQYVVGASDMARLELFNTLGVQVGTLADGYQTQGEHTVNFMIGSLPEGNYYIRLSSAAGQTTAALRIIH